MLDEVRRQALRRSLTEAAANRNVAAAIDIGRQFLRSEPEPRDVFFLSSSFLKLAPLLRAEAGVRQLRTYIVRSVTVEPMLPWLATQAVADGYVLDLRLGGYGSYIDDLLNPTADLSTFNPDLVLVLLDLEDVSSNLPNLCAAMPSEVNAAVEDCVRRISHLLTSLRSRSNAAVLLQGFVVPDATSLGEVGDANLPYSLRNSVRRINAGLAAFCSQTAACVFFDLDHLAGRHGRKNWRDERLFLSSRVPVAAEYFSPYVRGVLRSINALYKAPKKVLCTDLDQTLWGGVLGEDGPEGILSGVTFPGTPFYRYQQYLKQLSARGILIAVVSKNNEGEVREAFRARASDLALTFDDFTAMRINWNDKPQSLLELAEEFSLGLDSFVFVDDNPVECEAVRQALPEVAVVQAPIDEPWTLLDLLGDQPFFDTLIITDDDRERRSAYATERQRTALQQCSGGREEFLGSLGIECTFLSALDAPLSRTVQLLIKTNQFNLTTRRRSAAEVEEFARTGEAIAVRVRDRFGEAGVVGLALARYDGSVCVLDTLLLSCRVIGRGIETALLAHLAQKAKDKGATKLVGEYVRSPKNAPCATFYPDHGFRKIPRPEGGAPESLFYQLGLASLPASAPWIAVQGESASHLREASHVC